MASSEKVAQQGPSAHRTDAYAQKFDVKAEALQHKKEEYGLQKKSSSKPAGGFDETPIPQAPPGYTVKFTFHRAHHLPFGDLNTLSSDPFLLAQLNTNLPTRHKQDPELRFRSRTIQKTVEPEWNADWIVANVPASGFTLKTRIYDEDPADHDDRLGNVNITVDRLSEDWTPIKEERYKIEKRTGSKRAYFFRGCAAMFDRSVKMTGDLVMSVEVLGKTEGNSGGRAWTVGPCYWTKHFSPMIGMLVGTKEPGQNNSNGKKEAQKFNFQANQMQLAGPVPGELYHRYVEFKPFIAGMFTATSFRGRILNKALHHQHSRIYNFDRHTIYGSFPSPTRDMSLQFLDLVNYDKGGRIFTYVITLDGQWRFTETGKEFGIDMLSKHTMHSDVDIYIAFSGEFFIRRHPHKSGMSPEGDPNQDQSSKTPTHPPDDISGGPPQNDPPKEPEYYTLVIDNDSGTYRPNAKLLPQLRHYMQRNFPGLHVITLDCNGDKEKMDKWKGEQRERKKAEGKNMVVRQGSDSGSMSSSDEEDLEEQARLEQRPTGMTGDIKKDEGIMEKMKGKYEGAKEKFMGEDGYAEEEKTTTTNNIGEPEASKVNGLNGTGHAGL